MCNVEITSFGSDVANYEKSGTYPFKNVVLENQ